MSKRGFRKAVAVALIAAGASAVAAGCGRKTIIVQSNPNAKVYGTAQELGSAVEGKLEKVKSFSIEENFKIDAKITAYGQSSDLKLEGKGSGEIQMQPAYAHLNLDLSQGGAAGNASSKSETYISGTGSDAKGYIRTDGGSWTKDSSVTGIEFDALLEQFMGSSIIETLANGTASADIDNNGGQVNGKDTYKINTRVNGDIAGASFADSLSSLQMDPTDLSNLYADMELYIYKDSELPAKITVDGADFLEGVMDSMGIDCKVKEYTGEYIIYDYDAATDTLTIPDNVILEAGDTLPTQTAEVASGSLQKEDSKQETTESTTEATTAASSNKDEYFFYDSDSRLLTEADLEGMTTDEMRLARNEIFARRGRKFKEKELQDYYNSKSWYKPTIDSDDFNANVEKYLNKTEIANAEFIKSVEDKLKAASNVANEGSQLRVNDFVSSLRNMPLGTFKQKYGDVDFNFVREGIHEGNIPGTNLTVMYHAFMSDTEHTWVLDDNLELKRVAGKLSDIFEGLDSIMSGGSISIDNFVKELSGSGGKAATYEIIRSNSSLYEVFGEGEEFASITFDEDGDNMWDRELIVGANSSKPLTPDTLVWLYSNNE